jgi:hypothetical protein
VGVGIVRCLVIDTDCLPETAEEATESGGKRRSELLVQGSASRRDAA